MKIYFGGWGVGERQKFFLLQVCIIVCKPHYSTEPPPQKINPTPSQQRPTLKQSMARLSPRTVKLENLTLLVPLMRQIHENEKPLKPLL